MTSATQILRHEHEAIIRMLDAAEEVARELRADKVVASSILAGVVEFLQLFADRCHHGKEEDHLFPRLAEKGMPLHHGPIGMMLYEHDCGRALIGKMSEALKSYAAGENEAGRKWADAAHQYSDLLRGHIYKENNILFVMAEQLLSGSEQDALAQEFEKVELEKLGPGTHQRLYALMETLFAEIFKKSKIA